MALMPVFGLGAAPRGVWLSMHLGGSFAALLISAPTISVAAQPAVSVSRSVIQGPAEASTLPASRDALGRPCLNVVAAARAIAVTPLAFDHVLSLKNNCARPIFVQVCYFRSLRCNSLLLHVYQRLDTVIGTGSDRHFRYELTERRQRRL